MSSDPFLSHHKDTVDPNDDDYTLIDDSDSHRQKEVDDGNPADPPVNQQVHGASSSKSKKGKGKVAGN